MNIVQNLEQNVPFEPFRRPGHSYSAASYELILQTKQQTKHIVYMVSKHQVDDQKV